MLNDLIKLPRGGFKEALTRLVEEVYEGVRGNGSIMNPAPVPASKQIRSFITTSFMEV